MGAFDSLMTILNTMNSLTQSLIITVSLFPWQKIMYISDVSLLYSVPSPERFSNNVSRTWSGAEIHKLIENCSGAELHSNRKL